jgi:hypothetical protein
MDPLRQVGFFSLVSDTRHGDVHGMCGEGNGGEVMKMTQVLFRLFLIGVVSAPMLVTGAVYATTSNPDAFIAAVATTVWIVIVSFAVTKGFDE